MMTVLIGLIILVSLLLVGYLFEYRTFNIAKQTEREIHKEQEEIFKAIERQMKHFYIPLKSNETNSNRFFEGKTQRD